MYKKYFAFIIAFLLISTCFIKVISISIAEDNKSEKIFMYFPNKFYLNSSVSSNLFVDKKVWNNFSDQWVENITAYLGEYVKFNISIKYLGNDLLYNISVNDTLPDCIEYVDNSTQYEPFIDENNLFWNFKHKYLSPNESMFIEFDVIVISQSNSINSVLVKAQECGNTTLLISQDTVNINCINNLEAKANCYPQEIYENEYVSFTGNATGGSPPYSWLWDFNDGTSNSNQQNPIHQFNNPGYYNVSLTVIDSKGYYDLDTLYIIVKEDLPPKIEIIQPIENSLYFCNKYFFPLEKNTILIGKNNIIVNATDDLEIQRIEFYIDNNIQYTDYDEPYYWELNKGHFKHNIKVIAYDSSGQEVSSQIDIFQWKLHPIFVLMMLNMIRRNNDNQFNWIFNEKEWNSLLINLLKNLRNLNETSDISIREFIKKLNENLEENQTSFIIKFLNNHPIIKNKFKEAYPIIYIILFFIKNDNRFLQNENDKSIFTDESFIKSLLLKSSLIQILNSMDIFNEINFENTPVEWLKNHPLISIGLFIILLLLIKQIQKNINYEDENDDEPVEENIAPIAKIDGPYKGIINQEILFSAEKSYDQDGILKSYTWDFSDGNTASGLKVQHIFRKTGFYNVTLTITDDGGKSDHDLLKIEIIDDNSEFKVNEDEKTFEYVIISGALSSLLLIGIILLKFRRKYFE